LRTCRKILEGKCGDCDEDLLKKNGNYQKCVDYDETPIPLVINEDKKENGYHVVPDITRNLTYSHLR
jgi:hypothetical protein